MQMMDVTLIVASHYNQIMSDVIRRSVVVHYYVNKSNNFNLPPLFGINLHLNMQQSISDAGTSSWHLVETIK